MASSTAAETSSVLRAPPSLHILYCELDDDSGVFLAGKIPNCWSSFVISLKCNLEDNWTTGEQLDNIIRRLATNTNCNTKFQDNREDSNNKFQDHKEFSGGGGGDGDWSTNRPQ
ncbi:uncharacterized protein [Aegilops tauschii subsp. strangulata]|uniref:uncharacterized protein n=1 Tax=Aegilops tauschii subsp. strangulata TaxID=200361 RepID=UPI00098A61EC|nr:uncharacterized protein LOC123078460 [Triticum aestivum]